MSSVHILYITAYICVCIYPYSDYWNFPRLPFFSLLWKDQTSFLHLYVSVTKLSSLYPPAGFQVSLPHTSGLQEGFSPELCALRTCGGRGRIQVCLFFVNRQYAKKWVCQALRCRSPRPNRLQQGMPMTGKATGWLWLNICVVMQV